MVSRTKKPNFNTTPSPWLYVGTGLLLFIFLFFSKMAEKPKVAQQKQQMVYEEEAPSSPAKIPESPKEEGSNKEEENQESQEKQDIAIIETPSYNIPQSYNLVEEGITLGKRVRVKFKKTMLTIDYKSRSTAGERLYRIEVADLVGNNYRVFKSYDVLYAFHAADLNANGKVEVYLIWKSDGSGSYGMIEGYEITKGNFSPMSFPEQIQVAGYRGYDNFRIYPDYIEHSYPVYRENDSNSNNTAGIAYHRYSFAKNSLKAKVVTKK